MFKLVGSEVFQIGDTKCVIKIEPVGGFSYEYSLEVRYLNIVSKEIPIVWQHKRQI